MNIPSYLINSTYAGDFMTGKRNNRAKILMIDIETAPMEVYTFQLRDVTIGIDQIIHDSYMLCWAAKWLGKKRVMGDNLATHFGTKNIVDDESLIANSIWKLLDEADIVVAHNAKRFDVKWLNAVFLKYGLPPPSSFKIIDTLTESRKAFYQVSHRLNFLTKKYKIGEKRKHEGFKLWPKCMNGDLKAWRTMIKYNKQDVVILEKLYLLMRPYMTTHPNLNLYTNDKVQICESCEGKKFKKKGFAYTSRNKYQRYICLDCGRNVRDPKPIKD